MRQRRGDRPDKQLTSGNSLCKQGLARAWRTIKQESLRWPDPQPRKGFRVLHRQLNAFLELVDSIPDPANIAPANTRHLHHYFAHCAGLDALQRLNEVLARDT